MIRGRPGTALRRAPLAPSKASADGIAEQDFSADKSEMMIPATVPHLKVEQIRAG